MPVRLEKVEYLAEAVDDLELVEAKEPVANGKEEGLASTKLERNVAERGLGNTEILSVDYARGHRIVCHGMHTLLHHKVVVKAAEGLRRESSFSNGIDQRLNGRPVSGIEGNLWGRGVAGTTIGDGDDCIGSSKPSSSRSKLVSSG